MKLSDQRIDLDGFMQSTRRNVITLPDDDEYGFITYEGERRLVYRSHRKYGSHALPDEWVLAPDIPKCLRSIQFYARRIAKFQRQDWGPDDAIRLSAIETCKRRISTKLEYCAIQDQHAQTVYGAKPYYHQLKEATNDAE